jgi:hypothetical protein
MSRRSQQRRTSSTTEQTARAEHRSRQLIELVQPLGWEAIGLLDDA